MSRSRAFAASTLLLGAAFAGVGFGAAGGTELGRTTVVELLLVMAGGVGAAAALLWGRRGAFHGALALVGLAALTAVTALSILWSAAPELSFVDAGRMLSYLAVFGAAVGAARLVPKASPALLLGILLGALAVVAYALASRVWPGALAENEISNRLSQPYGYWNAVGTTAALMVPACLWLGSRRGGVVAVRAIAYPALGMAVLAILLSESRGALAAAAIGAIAWFALVPLRLRSLPVLLVPIAAAAPVAAWALSKDAFAQYAQPLAVKESVAGEFGLLLLAMVAALLAVGLAIGAGLARVAPPMAMRRRLGVVAAVVACSVPLVLFTSVAFSDRGLGGTIEDRVDELTSETASAPAEGAGRLTAASNSRSSFWREAGKVFEDSPGLGTGAGTFAVSRLRYRKSEQVSRHAHGFVPQTIADLGLLGLGVASVLLLAWLVAAARTTGIYPRVRRRSRPLPRRDWTTERVGLAATGLVAVVFGLQSAIDWTWFVPGPAVMALAAAGFVAGRGPLALEGAPRGPSRAQWRAPGKGRLLAAAALLVTTLLSAWAVWQPEASDRASNRALELIEAGEFEAAEGKALDAEDTNPLSPKPLLVEAAAETAAGRERQAEDTLERAVLRFPSDPQTWLRLASFQLGTADRPRDALQTVRGALYLDPRSKAGRRLFLDARSRLRTKQRAAAERRRRAAARRLRRRLERLARAPSAPPAGEAAPSP